MIEENKDGRNNEPTNIYKHMCKVIFNQFQVHNIYLNK